LSLHQDIRAALTAQAATASGFPATTQRAYDGTLFTPTANTPWVRLTFVPNVARPFDTAAAIDENRGMFLISLFHPSGAGTLASDQLADAVRDVFKPKDDLFQGSTRVRIERRERRQAVVDRDDPSWLMAVVVVYWRVYSTN
jgi:hypothetical protein